MISARAVSANRALRRSNSTAALSSSGAADCDLTGLDRPRRAVGSIRRGVDRISRAAHRVHAIVISIHKAANPSRGYAYRYRGVAD